MAFLGKGRRVVIPAVRTWMTARSPTPGKTVTTYNVPPWGRFNIKEINPVTTTFNVINVGSANITLKSYIKQRRKQIEVMEARARIWNDDKELNEDPDDQSKLVQVVEKLEK
ncbi:unnamed protein product [Linum trigynum]|uniref:Uncharacterized protein n=1 Tax=Linum trigynum TaxID=586398 RepID=A0AAV2E496_9ROSI